MKEMLVVVDYQNDFVNGSLGFEGAEKLEAPIIEKVREYRERNAEVVFTLDTHGEDYLATQEGKNLPIVHCIKGTVGHKLFGKVADCLREGDRVFEKAAFGSAKLFDYAKKEQFDSVELCGLVSNICVLSNAVMLKAANPECRVIVDSNCTACADAEENENALNAMRAVQIDIL